MKLTSWLIASACTAAVAFATPAQAQIVRRLERTFTVAAGHVVAVTLAGGGITASTGTGNQVQVTVTQTVRAGSDGEADSLLKDYDVSATQSGSRIEVVGQRRSRQNDSWDNRVQISATVTVPANVKVDLRTSGGSVEVRGSRATDTTAHTSGGHISADGGSGAMDLDTSGGRIEVRDVQSTLRATTSGGSITVNTVGSAATDVRVSTSGGSITIGIDPAAKLVVHASTSGGSVDAEGLTLNATSIERSDITGTMNGGGGRLSAQTSGGSVHLHAAR